MTWKDQSERILFAVGLLGISTEFGLWLVTGRSPDLTFTATFCTMVGLPTVSRGKVKG